MLMSHVHIESSVHARARLSLYAFMLYKQACITYTHSHIRAYNFLIHIKFLLQKKKLQQKKNLIFFCKKKFCEKKKLEIIFLTQNIFRDMKFYKNLLT